MINHNREVILFGLPPATKEVPGMWYKGYPIHKGLTESSMNFASLSAHEKKIVPDQKELKNEWLNFVYNLTIAGFKLNILPFPAELNTPEHLCHDAIFIRDGGIIYRGLWIQGRFSVEERKIEGEYHTRLIASRLNKTIVTVPDGCYLEGGEINYLVTKQGSFYFGGLSRANKQGHDFVREIIRPDNYILIQSEGYHLDTLFTPVVDSENNLKAFIIASKSVSKASLAQLKATGVPVIEVLPEDSSGEGDSLGNYSVNALIAPGVMVNSSYFSTPGVEEKLELLGIKRFVCPLPNFRYAGGSVHCLTNEVF